MKHPSTIAIQDYNYHLPPEKIALYPLKQRDGARLLVFQDNIIREDRFKHIGLFLAPETTLVFNTTKVIPARLLFTTLNGKKIELFCLEPARSHKDPKEAMLAKRGAQWRCLVGNLKQWKDEELLLENESVSVTARLTEREQGYQVVAFSWKPTTMSFGAVLEQLGQMPIPPYLKRSSEDIDKQRYQTVYAKIGGSVAAPTAGLHFTDRLLEELRAGMVDITGVTLHVSAGTFMPVKSETLKDHQMHGEWISVEVSAIQDLLKKPAGKIIAVGTTSLRTLETLYWMGVKALAKPDAEPEELEIGQWDPYRLQPLDRDQSLQALLDWMKQKSFQTLVCKTHILIAPPYDLKMAAGIITNFHQPQSTLLLLISAIVGDRWRDIYTYALLHDFRFLSYGDSSLLLK